MEYFLNLTTCNTFGEIVDAIAEQESFEFIYYTNTNLNVLEKGLKQLQEDLKQIIPEWDEELVVIRDSAIAFMTDCINRLKKEQCIGLQQMILKKMLFVLAQFMQKIYEQDYLDCDSIELWETEE